MRWLRRFDLWTVLRAVSPPVALLLLAGCYSFDPAAGQGRPGSVLGKYESVTAAEQVEAAAVTVPPPTVASVVRSAEALYRGYGLGSTGPLGAAWTLPLPPGFDFNEWLIRWHPTLSGRNPFDPVQDWKLVWSSSGQFHVVYSGDFATCLSRSTLLRPYVTPRVDPRIQYPPERSPAGTISGPARINRDCKLALAAERDTTAPPPPPVSPPPACNLAGRHAEPINRSTCTTVNPADGTACCWSDSWSWTAGMTRRCWDNPGCFLGEEPAPPPEPPVEPPPVQPPVEPPTEEPDPLACMESLRTLLDLLEAARSAARAVEAECRP